nr:MAG TPA: hypothetical protein [Caudoviricetes sp.]
MLHDLRECAAPSFHRKAPLHYLQVLHHPLLETRT